MSETAQQTMTVDEFLATAEEREGRWEIEDGLAYAMAPERLTRESKAQPPPL